MTLSPGDKLGPYEIVSAIGKGGMGEVWRARDTRLGRDVAIKFSAQQFSDRFEREARAIAALNHSNICTLFDVGPNYLVMEYIEGPTLADRIQEGPIPLEEALTIARQIADALEAAHEKNIVHRDLKPANVKIRPDGSVKVLDFGLAKAGGAETTVTHDSPTLLHLPTLIGMILGTAAYMAPEQARGKVVDKRADIWAFGVVLYEMLTGKRLFEGEDLTETLAAVVKSEPDLATVPRKVRRLLAACLQKDPKNRLRDIGDYRKLLDDEPPAVVNVKASSRLLPWLAAALFAAALALLAFVHFRERPPEDRVMRFTLPFPENELLNPFFALSPDGRRLAVWRFRDGKPSLWIRPLDSPDFQRLSCTDLVRGVFWSPDSRYIAFFAGGKLKTVPANGGPPQVVCEAGIYAEGTWSRDGVVLFSTDSGALERTKVSAGAGTGECTTLLPAKPGARQGHPSFLPDGKHFLYDVSGGPQGGIYLATLDAPNGRRLLADSSPVSFAPRSAGGRYDHILFLRDGNLMAEALDSKSFQLVGDAFPVAGQATINQNNGLAASAVSTGLLVYLSGFNRNENQLTWVDRSGRETGRIGMPGDASAVSLSPDGKTVAIQKAPQSQPPGGALSLLDLHRNIESAFQRGGWAVWSPDGSRVAMSTEAQKEIHLKDSSGGGKEQLLLKRGEPAFPTDWSRDGRYLLFTSDDPKTHQDIWYLENPLGPPADLIPKPFVQTEFREGRAQFSPDGRFVAYESEESGQREIYVRQFPSGPGKWKISGNGGGTPRWRRDGKELFYLAAGLMAVPVEAGSGGRFQAGEPKKLFDLRRVNQLSEAFAYAPSADGQRFLLLLPSANQSPTLNVITNWEKAASHP